MLNVLFSYIHKIHKFTNSLQLSYNQSMIEILPYKPKYYNSKYYFFQKLFSFKLCQKNKIYMLR